MFQGRRRDDLHAGRKERRVEVPCGRAWLRAWCCGLFACYSILNVSNTTISHMVDFATIVINRATSIVYDWGQ